MSVMKKEICNSYAPEQQESTQVEQCQDSCVSISGSLGLPLDHEGSPFFLSHQENTLKQSLSKIESDLQAKVQDAIKASTQPRLYAIADMILGEMGMQ